MRFRTLSRFFGLLLAASTGLASAADYYWDINGTTANGDGNGIFRASAGGTTWSTSPSGTAPTTFVLATNVGNNSSFQFGFGPAPDNTTNAGTVTIGNSTSTSNQPTVGALIFNASGTSGYTFQNNTSNNNVMSVTIRASATTDIGSGTGILVNSNVTGNTRFIRNPLNTAGAAGIILGANQTWTNNSTAYSLIVNTPITGTFALTTNGPGAIELGGANTFSSLNVSAGTVRVTSSGAIPAGGATVGAAGTLNVLAPVTTSIANSGTVSIGPGGNLTASSLGAGTLSIAGVSGSAATFTNSLASGTLSIGPVGMAGNATIAMPVAGTINSSGVVSLSGADNLLTVSGVAAAGNTYTLLKGASLANTGAVSLTGAAVGNATITLGSSVTVGRNTYSFTSTANALNLVTTGSQVTLTWTGATDNVWDYSTDNWTTGSGNTYFGAGDNGQITSAAAITVRPEGVIADTLTVSNASGTASLAGGSVTATSLTKSAAGAFSFDNALTAGNVTLSGGVTTVSGTGSLTATSIANDAALVIASSGTQTLAAMSGTGSLAYTGGSTLSLTSSSSYNGAVSIGAGSTLRVAGAGVLGSGSFTSAIANDGTLDLSGTAAQVIAGAISGAGSVTKGAVGAATLSGNNSYAGSTSVTAGTLILGSGSALGTADGSTTVSVGAVLNLNGQSVAAEALALSGTGIAGSGGLTNSSTSTASWGGSVTLGSAATGIGGAGNISIAGGVGGSGGLTKFGENMVTLSGNSSFAGTLNILAGTVQAANPAALPNVPLAWSSSNSSSTLDLVDSGTYSMASMAMGSILRVKTSGSGQATLTIAGNSTLGGSANKTLQADQNATIVVDGMIDLASTSTRSRNVQFQGAGDIVLNGMVMGGGTNQFGIIKNADFADQTGTLSLNGTNVYNGVTQITGGTLKIGNPQALGSTAAGTTLSSPVFSGGTLDLNGQAVVDETLSMDGTTADAVDYGVAVVNSSTTAASWSGGVALSAGSSGIGGLGDITVSGSVTGSGNLRKVGFGTVTLENATNTGATFIDEGALTLGAASVLNAGGGIWVAADATLNVLGSASGPVGSQGTIAVGPGGRLTSPDFGGGSNYYGAFTLAGSAGSLATLSDTGTSGFVNRVASVTMGGDAQIDLVVGSMITASGPVTISGTGNLLSLSGIAIKGSTYSLLSGSSILNTGAIAATGSLLGNQTVSLGSSVNIGRSTYSFAQSGTSLVLSVSGTQYNLTWTGSANNLWNYSSVNWQSGGIDYSFDPGDNATIASAATITVDAAGVAADTVTVSNATGTVSLDGGTLTANSLVKTAAGLFTANNNIDVINGVTLSDGTFQIGAAGSLNGGSYSGPIANNAALVYSGSNNQTLGGVISGTGSLTQSGAGTLFLTGTSTSTGNVSIAAGSSLKVSDSGVLGSGTFVGGIANDGTFTVSSVVSQTMAGTISGSGAVTIQTGTATPATITLAGNNTYSGVTTVGSGSLQLGSATALGSTAGNTTVTAGGVLDLNGQSGVAEPLTLSSSGISNSGAVVNSNTSATASVAGTVTLNDNSTGLGGSGTTNLTGLVTGSGGLTKWGEGTLTLSGSANYGGITSIQAGTLRVQNPSVLVSSTLQSSNSASSSAFDMATSGTYSTGFLLVGQSFRIGTSGTGPATLAVANGTLNGNIDKVLEVGANATVLVSGTFDLRNSGTATRNLVVGGAGNTVFNGVISGTSTTNPALLFGIYVGGSATTPVGMTALNGANTYNGPTTVSTGTLRLGNAQALGSTSAGTVVTTSTVTPGLAGGVLDLNGQAIVGESLTLNSTGEAVSLVNSNSGAAASWSTDVAVNGAVSIGGAGGITLPGNLTGSASLTKIGVGRVTLSGNNTYTGSTNVASGTLTAASATAIPSASAASVAAGATLDLGGSSPTLGSLSGSGSVVSGGSLTVGAGNASSAFDGVISGAGRLTKVGSGTLALGGANTLTGSTTVQQGTLQLANGSALASSKIVPLAGGTVSLTSYLQTTVGGLDPNAGGLVDVGSGYVTVASGLSVPELTTALVAGRGDGSWTGTSGITSSVAAADVASSVPRTVGWLDNGDGSVSVAFAAPGDTNIDWSVDVLDASNFLSFGKFDTGLLASWQEGDFNYDGVVDVLDAADFFGTGLYDAGSYNPPPGAAGIAAVPEPSTLALLAGAIAAAAGTAFRSRRSRCSTRRQR
jgi:autotransporter-associated beta strand protein